MANAKLTNLAMLSSRQQRLDEQNASDYTRMMYEKELARQRRAEREATAAAKKAQDNAKWAALMQVGGQVVGGLAGAAIGGIPTGGIGAAPGAAIGSQLGGALGSGTAALTGYGGAQGAYNAGQQVSNAASLYLQNQQQQELYKMQQDRNDAILRAMQQGQGSAAGMAASAGQVHPLYLQNPALQNPLLQMAPHASMFYGAGLPTGGFNPYGVQ